MANAKHPAFHHVMAAALLLLAMAPGTDVRAAGIQHDHQAGLAKTEAEAAAALHLSGVALGDHELTGIRGGFDPAPGITLNFAFQQTTYQNHQLIQSTIIPETTIQVSPSGSAGLAQSISHGTSGSLPPAALAGAEANPAPLQNTPYGAVRTAGLPANQNAAVLTEISPSGITNVIKNTSNNQLLQQATIISIGISGLNQLLSRQAQAIALNHTMMPGH